MGLETGTHVLGDALGSSTAQVVRRRETLGHREAGLQVGVAQPIPWKVLELGRPFTRVPN